MRSRPETDPEHRWDGDFQGQGIADATRLVHGASELLEAMGRREWVAEAPEAHLLPHLEAWCERPESPFRLQRTMTEPDGCFEVALEWQGEGGGVREVRAACFALLGQIAESGTYVRQRLPPGSIDVDLGGAGQEAVFEVATGMLDPDTPFASHGHTIRLRVLGASG